ncbi:hypothetical protein [Sphingosinicella sp. CPCC 101087]|uniref:hypothetical protein n=1 Tax=Sphingosinicella sp. CPCC 101087 TaxID=2497754 RepID=UPI00101CC889|nr:hypothetical protein [Sphingosinicella sp. CPCC 101087]
MSGRWKSDAAARTSFRRWDMPGRYHSLARRSFEALARFFPAKRAKPASAGQWRLKASALALPFFAAATLTPLHPDKWAADPSDRAAGKAVAQARAGANAERASRPLAIHSPRRIQVY